VQEEPLQNDNRQDDTTIICLSLAVQECMTMKICGKNPGYNFKTVIETRLQGLSKTSQTKSTPSDLPEATGQLFHLVDTAVAHGEKLLKYIRYMLAFTPMDHCAPT
jgi:hypothetical protein